MFEHNAPRFTRSRGRLGYRGVRVTLYNTFPYNNYRYRCCCCCTWRGWPSVPASAAVGGRPPSVGGVRAAGRGTTAAADSSDSAGSRADAAGRSTRLVAAVAAAAAAPFPFVHFTNGRRRRGSPRPSVRPPPPPPPSAGRGASGRPRPDGTAAIADPDACRVSRDRTARFALFSNVCKLFFLFYAILLVVRFNNFLFNYKITKYYPTSAVSRTCRRAPAFTGFLQRGQFAFFPALIFGSPHPRIVYPR